MVAALGALSINASSPKDYPSPSCATSMNHSISDNFLKSSNFLTSSWFRFKARLKSSKMSASPWWITLFRFMMWFCTSRWIASCSLSLLIICISMLASPDAIRGLGLLCCAILSLKTWRTCRRYWALWASTCLALATFNWALIRSATSSTSSIRLISILFFFRNSAYFYSRLFLKLE